LNQQARLIIVCGLPGSGKTTHAKILERRLPAVRLSADDWMQSLSVNLHDEKTRGEIEALQWKLSRRLLPARQTVVAAAA
jgi:predicted kinase